MHKKALYYFFFLLFFLTLLSSGVVDSQDGFSYLAVARNIYYKSKPTAPPSEDGNRKNVHMTVVKGRDGENYSVTGLGFSLALLPAVAITDVVYKIYGVSPPAYFPLENDWLILLTASFTNAFFGAALGVIMYKYFILLGLNANKSFWFSLVSILATNILAYTKHIWPHMMFTTFTLLSFYLLKRFTENFNRKTLLLSGFCLGVVAITYNITFLLVVPSLLLYYLILRNLNLRTFLSKKIAFDLIVFLIGLLPGLLTYLWFEYLRSTTISTLGTASPVYLGSYARTRLITVPISILYEGVYEQLLSPGRGLFLYSPILLLIVIFWNKVKRSIKPELVVFLSLCIVYVLFYSAQYGGFGQAAAGFWHGESSWGPRYLIPLIPFGMLVVSNIYLQLKKFQKVFIVLPLLIIGFYIEILGVLMPYQIKYHDLERSFQLNGVDYTMYYYTNLLPRYSSVLMMSKKIVKNLSLYPKTFDHGVYNVKYYDGIDLPFNVGPERWRVIEGKGYISFDNNSKNSVKELTFGLINHPITEASESATIQFTLNDQPLLEKSFQLDVTKRELVKIPIKESLVRLKDNQLIINVDYPDSVILAQKKQILGLQSFDINNQRQNMESIDAPYVSALGPKMGAKYQNWGKMNQDPWRYWDLHTQIFERVPDFWWIRNLYYWDIPKKWIVIPFLINISALLFFAVKLFSTIRGK